MRRSRHQENHLLNDKEAVPPDVGWHRYQQVLRRQVQLHHHIITMHCINQLQPNQLMLYTDKQMETVVVQ